MQLKSIGIILVVSALLYFLQRTFFGMSGPGLLSVVVVFSIFLVVLSASKNIIFEFQNAKKYEVGLAFILAAFAYLPSGSGNVFLSLYNFAIGFLMFFTFYIGARIGFEKLKKGC